MMDESTSTVKSENKWDTTTSSSSSSSAQTWDSTRSGQNVWDATPVASTNLFEATPVATSSSWDATPRRSNRWDATPAASTNLFEATPSGRKRSRWDETPIGGTSAAQTPSLTAGQVVLAHVQQLQQTDIRYYEYSDAELDAYLPEGYEILAPPPGYQPPAEKLLTTPLPSGFTMPATPALSATQQAKELGLALPPELEDIPFTSEEDVKLFGALLEHKNEEDLPAEEANERRILLLLLKVKNGAPPQRKSALRQLADKARVFGAGALFRCILPVMTSPALTEQERHLLVKVLERVMDRLGELVRPHAAEILRVMQPMLLDADYYARAEAREVIANLAKAAGLATMLVTMRPDIDSPDEYVRNVTARALAVIASALGVSTVAPFLAAVCASQKSWEARHSGLKAVQQIALLLGAGVLPHLRALVSAAQGGLSDENSKVRCMSALALSALAEAACPYGLDAFDSALRPLWEGVRTQRGKPLAAFLKAVGFVVALMSPQHAAIYAKPVLEVVAREFATADEEMRRIVLRVARQLVSCEALDAAYIRTHVLHPFATVFWARRSALESRVSTEVVETTAVLALRVGQEEVLGCVCAALKDESEALRRMAVSAVKSIASGCGGKLVLQEDTEARVVEGVLHAFQTTSSMGDDAAWKDVLDGAGALFTALGDRAKAYLPQVFGLCKWRLNNKNAPIRRQAAELVARVSTVAASCGEQELLSSASTMLFESLGEEFPEVLAAVLGALRAVARAGGVECLTPPVSELVPRLTPILKNRVEAVQAEVVNLMGLCASDAGDQVHQKEWVRICFDLLDLLRAPKKAVRRSSTATLGAIARAIGPQEILGPLLQNLRVLDRTNRVCTAVALAIVADICQPFTVLPALMNEYRSPDASVQQGVLKAFVFVTQYVGALNKDYVYALAPMLQDALIDRDIVRRQTACAVTAHVLLGVAGLGREDVALHLLNLVWPNIFETSPHVAAAVRDAVEAARVALGPSKLLQYLLQGLFHPARRVRSVYWKHYNAMYVAAQDALVAAFPVVEDDEDNTWRRWELEVIL